MMILGIDDAGRGPVVGPMILAGCLVNEEIEKEFEKLGVTDSKKLTPKRREFLAEKIKGMGATFKVELSYPDEIESKNKEGIDLNKLEALKVAEIINKINKGYNKIKVIIDCPSVGIKKWDDYLRTKIKNLSNLDISCEHKADKNHISVSAASILAKSTREAEMDKIKKKYGDEIGSGYTSDPNTCKFLAKYAEKYQDDGIFRKTWVTWQKAYKNLSQKKLF